MNRKLFALAIGLTLAPLAQAQIICIMCYDQNERVFGNVTDLIMNGSLENTSCTYSGQYICPNSMSYSCDINNWTCTGGGPSTYACHIDNNFSIIANGLYAAYLGNFYCTACPIDTLCIIGNECTVMPLPDGYPTNTPDYGGLSGISLSQTVTGLTPGAVYTLEFWSGGEGGFYDRGLFGVDLGFGNTLFRCRTTPAMSNMVGTRYVIAFQATSSSHTVKFTNWGHPCYTCTEFILDDVRLFQSGSGSTSLTPCMDAVSELQAPVVRVYPDPFVSTLTVENTSRKAAMLDLFDISGRPAEHQGFSGSMDLSVDALPSGLYIYRVSSADGVLAQGKVVKE